MIIFVLCCVAVPIYVTLAVLMVRQLFEQRRINAAALNASATETLTITQGLADELHTNLFKLHRTVHGAYDIEEEP